MERIDSTLLAIGFAKDDLQPVQLQKTLFLFAKRTPERALPKAATYDFVPYDYGPFSADVYQDAEELEKIGLITISRPPVSRYKRYRLTDAGEARKQVLLNEESNDVLDFLRRIVEFTQALSFNQLVSAIYRDFPEMRENSVFKEVG